MPRELAKKIALMPSRADLAMSVLWSPRRPLSIAPTMAIAPTQNSSDALTKPRATLPVSPRPRVTFRSRNAPRSFSRFSMLMAAPISAPATMHMIMHRVSPVFSAPLRPIRITQRP